MNNLHTRLTSGSVPPARAMSDDLRDRIAGALRREADNGGNRTEDYAQAIIDDLGLVDERTVRAVDYGAGVIRIPERRVVGKWERS